MWLKTYGNLYRKVTLETGEIPIGIYRTVEKKPVKELQNVRFKLQKKNF